MKKVSLITGAVLALTLLASPAQAATDLPNSHRFFEEMTYLQNKGVISGFEDGTLRPDKTVSRAEAAIMIGKLKGLDGTQRDSQFKDVPKSLKASGYIAAAAKAGYVSGYENGTFKPDAPITRGDMAIILSRVFPLGMKAVEDLKDVSPNMRAYEAIGGVIRGNIAAGYPDKTFKPIQATTRAQFSAFVARGLEPKFQNDTHMAHSYLMDKTKTYTFQYWDGVKFDASYVKPKGKYENIHNFLWVNQSEDVPPSYFSEYETSEELQIGYPGVEYHTQLVYPIQKGTLFNEDGTFSLPAKITNVGMTIETKYKTFKNAVEVTILPIPQSSVEGSKYYLVEGYGIVKEVAMNGELIYELIAVK
ncbi:S-layer homology domain-containing protein [Planococcus sp. N064]|uniref:S-layer homology domain-containing protein n=1 Tax=Planococcus liqunii TaxID=3058394 RepID=A0ABT8MNU8_9BACL|nr:S-layer homology domain-containing protein [Planococcus sp. N064]MDN7226450.1 S-layer homology domain-containing protein [Planococcus sp. N064]